MYQRKNNLLIVCLLLLSMVIYCSSDSSETSKVEEGYNFTLTGLNGEPMNFADLRGKAVMLNIWASWCPPCINEMPIFVRLYEKYHDKGLEIWGVSTDILGKSDVEPVIKKLNINYPILLATTSELAEILGIPLRYIPVTIFFDTKGRIVYTLIGAADPYVNISKGETVESWFEKKILEILPEK